MALKDLQDHYGTESNLFCFIQKENVFWEMNGQLKLETLDIFIFFFCQSTACIMMSTIQTPLDADIELCIF